MSAPFSTKLFSQLPIVGILRGLPPEKLGPVVEAVRDGGLTNLEITMNTPGAAEQIRAAREIAGSALNIGAGTVTNLQSLEDALAAGASFIVTPTLVPAVIERCVQLKVPVFPGAFSPTEIQSAWELGATMVKIFPADALGPGYLRSLKAPLPHLKLMPTGGVDVTTLAAYAQAGADAFGVGSPLFRAERIAADDWEWLRNQCRAFAKVYRKTK
jgi:2-dehydro-3-deoxyphosphogluconate aldolase/(4S)-4-hydroxy-2-oxoglutarate aldolase